MSDGAAERSALLEAVCRSIDADKLVRELGAHFDVDRGTDKRGGEKIADRVLEKIVLADLLDESILEARPGERAFSLRLFLGELGARLTEESAFSLASGLNFYFRTEMDEEARMRLGVEVSRQYYRFVYGVSLSEGLIREVSPELASLLSGELERLSFESVDQDRVFDSVVHERELTARAESATIARPASFLCRIRQSGAVRVKARVVT